MGRAACGPANVKSERLRSMKRKIIPVLIAIVLILLIGAGAVGSFLYERYSYSKERADIKEYFGVSGDRVAIVLQDEIVEEQALLRDGHLYFELAVVHQYFNEIFYGDKVEGLLLYTDAVDTYRLPLGGSAVESGEGSRELGYVGAFLEDDTIYVAADYIRQFTNCSIELFENHVQVYTQWGVKQMADVKKATSVRIKGGVKSEILRDLEKGAQVEVLEQMETWSRVKTADSMIGYVENKLLENITEVQETPVTDYAAPAYTTLPLDGKVSLGWHAIGGVGGNETLESMVSGTKGMNVIAPTWFSLNDNVGGFRSYASQSYVDKAHSMGLKVWGVLDDFNYNNENKAGLEVYRVLSSTANRQKLVDNITREALSYKLDGINIDFEKISVDSGIHYVQFLRELSVQCRKNGLVLSVDNYVPFHFNDYYRLDIQGQVVDYVIIMGYDEHWHGSKDPGSVASIGYVENGIAKTLDEVPANKVVNALPLYTILWKLEGAEVTDEYLTIRNTEDFLNRVGAEPVWDEETCQNYAEWTDGGATYRIWLEDEQSIGVKLNVMASKEIGGVAVWRLGYGTSGVWELINAYVNS